MDGLSLGRSFARMGARVECGEHNSPTGVRVDVKRDDDGEFFEILAGPRVRVVVPDVRPDLQHLLLVTKEGSETHRFLCGHDERHWFAAAVPGAVGISGVRSAVEALKPPEVRRAIERNKVRSKQFMSRKTAAYVRQGEWFFLPAPDITVHRHAVIRNEPMRRGGGKAHIAQFAYRQGGELVYVCETRRDLILTAEDYEWRLRAEPNLRKLNWRSARRNAGLYVKGKISHPDHATISLSEWHLVRMNTENEAPSMRHLAFID